MRMYLVRWMYQTVSTTRVGRETVWAEDATEAGVVAREKLLRSTELRFKAESLRIVGVVGTNLESVR